MFRNIPKEQRAKDLPTADASSCSCYSIQLENHFICVSDYSHMSFRSAPGLSAQLPVCQSGRVCVHDYRWWWRFVT